MWKRKKMESKGGEWGGNKDGNDIEQKRKT